jgi:hypothetical protein
MNIQYVYLIQTEEFVISGEPVYKIGKTKQLNYTRFKQYDRGSIQLYQSICKNCDDMEKKIIALFNSKYERHRGKEYFKGNPDDMLDDISELVKNERLVSGLVSDIVGDIIENIVDIVVEETIVEEVVNEEVVNEEVVDEEVVNTKTAGIDEVTTERGNIQNKKFGCIPCNYYSNYSGNVRQHKETATHIEVIRELEGQPRVETDNEVVKSKNKKLKCLKCDKIYITQSGCWRHTKKCTFVIPLPPSPPIPSFDPTELINEIKELTELINEIKEKKTKIIENIMIRS